MIQFAHPWFLLLAVIIPALIWWYRLYGKNQEGTLRLSSIDFLQGRIGNAQANVNIPGRRIGLDIPLLSMGGGLLSGQGSWSPYGNNYLGFQYRKDW